MLFAGTAAAQLKSSICSDADFEMPRFHVSYTLCPFVREAKVAEGAPVLGST